MRQPRRTTLVIIEDGASWPKWLHPCRSGDLVLVAPDGEGSSLISQVTSRLTEVEAIGWVLAKAVLVVGPGCEVDAVRVRSILLRALIARLERARAGELVLSSDQPAGSAVHHGLIELAAAIDDAGVRVTVRVGAGESVYESSRPPVMAPAPL